MPVMVEIAAPDCVILAKGTKKIELEATVSLVNDMDHDAVLAVANSNDVMFWHLLDANQKEVQRMPAGGKPKVSKDGMPVMDRRIPRGERVAFPETIELDAGKLKDGGRYILRVRAWGRTAEHEIKVTALDKVPTAPKEAPAGPPKAKGAAAKGTAAKGAAAKSGGAKKSPAKKTKKAA